MLRVYDRLVAYPDCLIKHKIVVGVVVYQALYAFVLASMRSGGAWHKTHAAKPFYFPKVSGMSGTTVVLVHLYAGRCWTGQLIYAKR